MKSPLALIFVGLSLFLLARAAPAQPAPKRPAPPPAAAGGPEEAGAKTEADLIREGQQAQARSLLFTLSGEARGFRDQWLQARSLARIADALWEVAEEQARGLFREAWEAAEEADREGEGRPGLREEVLTLSAGRDHRLAEEFLQRLRAGRQETKAAPQDAAPPPGNSLWELPDAAEKRLALASNLLRAGDVRRAEHFADPVLGAVTISTLDFLTDLRERDAAAADLRYSAMLANVSADAAADANTVSLLSSYIFTPRTYVIFNSAGGADSVSTRTPHPPADVAPQLRLAFFRAARAVLLRPQPPPGQDRGTAGFAGKYMVLRRLMPLVERHAPPETAAALRGHFEALHALAGEGLRQDDEWVRKGVVPERSAAEQEGSLLEEVERARTSGERDQLYFRLALLALDRDDPAAREYAGRIEDESLRKGARAWVDWGLAVRAVGRKRAEAAAALAEDGELTAVQRVWVWTRAAKLLAEADRERALSLAERAAGEVGRVGRADPDRPRALLAVAGALWAVEPARAWAVVSDAVEAANLAEGFTGEGGGLTLSVNAEARILKKFEAAPEFDVGGIFGELAGSDFGRAAQMARGFKGEAARTNAVIAASRAVLKERRAPRAAKGPGARK